VDPAKAAPETPPGAVPATPVEPNAAPDEQFSVVYGRKEIFVEGSKRVEGGYFFPDSTVVPLKQAIGRAEKYAEQQEADRRRRAEFDVRVEQFNQQMAPAQGEVANLFKLAEIEDPQQRLEATYAYVEDLRANLPALRARIELAKERAELEVAKRANQPDPTELVSRTAVQTIQEMKSNPSAKLLTDQDWQDIYNEVLADPQGYTVQVGQHITEEQRANGLQPGEMLFNDARLVQEARKRLLFRQELQRQADDHARRLKEATQIAKDNATKLAAERISPPPAPAPAGSTPAPEARTGQRFKNRAEWDAWTESEGR
jgi:hypothetical protein